MLDILKIAYFHKFRLKFSHLQEQYNPYGKFTYHFTCIILCGIGKRKCEIA
jgi:hypothetical protein